MICFPIYLSGNMKEFIWKKSGKVKNLYGKCEGLLKKHRQLYGKMPHLTEKAEEFIWQKFGKVKNSYGNVKDLYKGKVKNFYGKMTNSSGQAKEFIWSNGILSIGFLTSTVF